MSIAEAPPLQHPVLGEIGVLDEACDGLGEASTWSMGDAELREALPGLTRLISRLSGVRAALLAEADRRDLGDVEGHHDAAGWFANATRTTKPVAKGLVRLARSLDSEAHGPVREALADGRVLPEQARVIIEAVDALPTDLPSGPAAGLIEEAERHLVALAEFHDAKALRVLGRRILEVVDPDAADEHERRLLEADEARAAAKTSLTLRSDGQGMVLGRFAIPELAGAMLKKHLDALAAPRHRATLDHHPEDRLEGGPEGVVGDGHAKMGASDAEAGSGAPLVRGVSRPLRLGEAFVEYVTTRPTDADGIPKAGGTPATVVVTMTEETLTGRLEQAGLLDTGERISPSAARTLACNAGIIPAVLGTGSQVLDLGRRTRFHTMPQRIAIALRDKGCAEAHCDWPPGMCHVHHRTPWSRGGHTDTRTGLMLCPRHHTLAHDSRYEMTDTMHGKVRFTRRT